MLHRQSTVYFKTQYRDAHVSNMVKQDSDMHAAWQIHTEAHIRRSGLKVWLKLLTAQRSGAAWIPHGCIFTLSPAPYTPAAIDRTHTIFLLSSLSPRVSLSFAHPLSPSLPARLPSCLSHCSSQRPFIAYLTKQHTTHTAYLSPPGSGSLSLSEKTEILRLAAAAMSHDLIPPLPSHLPPHILPHSSPFNL